ncbi:unnamed protein product [Calypogeia fissa]
MSSMFGGGFKATKCKTLLRLAMARIKLLRNKRDIQIKQMRKDIAQLLSTGQEPSARIRVEHIAREQNVMAAYDIIELFCELIIVRLPIIESQKACPMDLKEAVSSLIFASPRCADLPELLQIRGLFTSKYGKEFVAAAAELRPECGVNRRIIEKLSVRAPSGQTKLKLLTEIAAEHNVDWDPVDSEAELMKQPEDLLDGHKKFFGASEGPLQEPSPPVPPAQTPPPTPPAPSLPSAQAANREPGPITMNPLPVYSSESEEETPPSREKKQYIPFVGPVPPKGIPAGKDINPSTKGSSSTGSSTKGDPRTQGRKEGPADYEEQGSYNNVQAAAKAAAENAERAVAAARAAAELAKTHPSKREPPSRSASKDVEPSSSEEESEEDEDEDIVESSTSGRKNEPTRPAPNVSLPKTKDTQSYGEKPDAYSRSSFDGSLRRSNSEGYEDGSYGRRNQYVEPNTFSRTSSTEERPEKDLNSGRKFDSEQDSYWRSGDNQDWRRPAIFAPPEKKFESSGFFPVEEESLYRRDSDLFKVGTQSDEPYLTRAQDRNTSSSTSKLFSSGESGRNLFARSSSEEKDLRSSDETPFYDSKPAFATPKFDDEEEEVPFTKSKHLTTDLSFKRDFDKRDLDSPRSTTDSPRAKPTFREFWQSSSFSYAGDEPPTPKLSGGDYQPEKQHSDSYKFDTPVRDPPSLSRGGSDPTSTKSFYSGEEPESLKQENQSEATPIPKSRRTRKLGKSRDSFEGSVGSPGSGGLPPSGRPLKYSSSENVESAPSPEYYSPIEPDNLSAHSFDDSPTFPPKSSLFNNSTSASAPPDRAPPSISSAYESPDALRDSSSSVRAGSTSSRSSPSLERKDSPSAPAIHPKLPDYDDLTARFEALKGKGKR